MRLVGDWNGQAVPVRYSRGGVLTFELWEHNVLGSPPWPEALLRQVNGHTAQPRWFAQEDLPALTAHLDGRISRFQSVNSEDAVTYSWFGTLAPEPVETRRAVAQWLYDRAGIAATAREPRIDQWLRVFHPHRPGSSRGPELDVRIDDPGAALVYVEAKWGADLGTGGGKDAGVRDDQIVLRRDSLRTDPALRDDDRAFAVLVVSEAEPDLTTWHEADADARPVTVASLSWDDLAACPAHPLADEFGRCLAWKRAHGRQAAAQPVSRTRR